MSERRANQALLVAATAMFLGSFVTTASNIAIPVLEDGFPRASLSTISWVVSAFNVTQVTFMLLGGAPLDAPRHMWWNFVHSDPARIARAQDDWEAGRFAAVPGETEFIPLPAR